MIAAVLVGCYSVLGGLMADAVTDVIQGTALIVGLIALTVSIAWAAGHAGTGLAAVEPERLRFFSTVDMGVLERTEKLAVVLTMDYLHREAQAGRREDFERYLASVPNVAPAENDHLD